MKQEQKIKTKTPKVEKLEDQDSDINEEPQQKVMAKQEKKKMSKVVKVVTGKKLEIRSKPASLNKHEDATAIDKAAESDKIEKNEEKEEELDVKPID